MGTRPLFNVCASTLLIANALFAQAQGTDEFNFLAPTTASGERTISSQQLVLWTLPFETTQFIPMHPTPAMREAIAAQKSGRFLDAIVILEAIKDDAGADTPDLALLRASYYLQGDQAKQARHALGALLERFPDSADAYALMAMSHLQQGQPAAAWTAVQKARHLARRPLVSRVASYVLQAQGRLEQASAEMAVLNAQPPAAALNLAREAELALSLGDIARAADRVARARELEPQSPYVMAVSGLVWLIEGESAQAQAAFEQALKRDPNDAKALLGLGLAEARLGENDSSTEHLRQAAKSDPGSALIRTYLGRALQQAGHVGEAQEAYRTAIKLDPQDPAPWMYLAQSQIEAGRMGAAQESLRQAARRKDARGVYRGQALLLDDAQTQQANLARLYRHAGLHTLSWQALSDGVDEKSAITLKNQAEALQNFRFGETARRSLALQSLFNDARDALPVTLDVYGAGAGQTGASVPQSGAISGLAGQASVGNYGALFNRQDQFEIEAALGNRRTWGEAVRGAAGNERWGFSLAQRHYESEGFSRFNGLDNTVWQGVLKWDPSADTRVFLSYQDFRSERGTTYYPADIDFFGANSIIQEKAQVARLGLRRTLSNQAELRAVAGHQRTDLDIYYESLPSAFFPFSFSGTGEIRAEGGELQYRKHDAGGLWIAGLEAYRERAVYPESFADSKTRNGQVYVAQTLRLNPHWDLDWALGRAWRNTDDLAYGNDLALKRWTPRLGLVFSPSPATHLRFAVGQHLGLPQVGDASLAPVETAGIVNTRPNEIGKLVKSAGVAFDHRLGASWLTSGGAQIRRTWEPVNDGVVQSLSMSRYQESSLGLSWMPLDSAWMVTLGTGYERRIHPDVPFALDSVSGQRLRDVKLLFNGTINSRLSVKGEISRNWVDGVYQVFIFGPRAYRDASTQLNASVRWQHRQSAVEFGVRNLLDDTLEYTESDPLAPRFSVGRFVYGSAKLDW